MRAIFISYRRDDAEGQAGRLFRDLTQHFGDDAVFMDVAAMEMGRDFRRAIDEQVASCGVLLAIIGKSWLTAKDESGARRLDDPMDFVRLETASALKRDIPVVPVLVHAARIPRVEDLPEELKELAFRNGVELTHARWDSDVQVLVKALRPYVQAKQEPTRPRPPSAPSEPGPTRKGSSRMIIAALVGVLVLALGGYVWHQRETAAQEETLAMAAAEEEKAKAKAQAKAEAAREAAALREAKRLTAAEEEKAKAKAQAEAESARQAEEARQAAEAEARNKEVASRRQAEAEAKAKAEALEEAAAQEQRHAGATQTTDGWAIIGRHQRGRFSEPVLRIDGDRPAIGRSYKATQDFRLVQRGPEDDQKNAVITLGMVHRGDSVEVLEIAPGTSRGPVYAKLRAVLHPVQGRSR